MKRFTVILFSILSTTAFSQQTINVAKDDYNTGNLFFSVGGEPVVMAKFVRLVEGSPFFKNEWLKSTIISTQNVLYKDVSVKLDLLDNQFHYLDPKGNEFIANIPVKEITLTDPIYNKNFRFVYSPAVPSLNKGWYLSLVEGKASLYKTFSKNLIEQKPYGSATTEQRIETKEKFLVAYNDQSFYVKSVKDALALFTDKKAELQAFHKQQNNSLSTEDKLVELITHYNTLVK